MSEVHKENLHPQDKIRDASEEAAKDDQGVVPVEHAPDSDNSGESACLLASPVQVSNLGSDMIEADCLAQQPTNFTPKQGSVDGTKMKGHEQKLSQDRDRKQADSTLSDSDESCCFALPLERASASYDPPYISATVLAQLVRGGFIETVANYQLIDCRYPYEFDGGHIKSAVNVHTADDFDETFFGNERIDRQGDGISVIVFYCEYSQQRGPKMYRRLKREYQKMAKGQSSNFDCPEMYLLADGYRKFFRKYPHMCSPENYVKMSDGKFGLQDKCRRERTDSFRKKKQGKKEGEEEA
uniref:protein-tyrosine-phosphatase n=1 Tax=Trichuris muris TaxID=70415 RepID=A0A5S6Q9M4_TRIMR